MPVVELRDVTRRYGATRALDKVTLDVERGTLTALTGPNGAGKSTFLRIAATLESPDSGSVVVDGADAGRAPAEVRRRIGWLGHEPGLYDELTVRENLRFAARLHGRGTEIERAAASVGIAHRLEERARSLSRGERQRAALARALLGGPVLLLDEPTTALDDAGAQSVVALLRELRAERTILVATHDARLVAASDRAVALNGGRLR